MNDDEQRAILGGGCIALAIAVAVALLALVTSILEIL